MAAPQVVTERPVSPQESEREVLPTDVRELNDLARRNGWIRDVFYQYDDSSLTAEARDALAATASWLRRNEGYRLRIEGHCDERGTSAYNLALGERRAESARAYLAQLGVAPGRLETVSYGEERPFATGSDEAAWAQNRRAHMVIIR